MSILLASLLLAKSGGPMHSFLIHSHNDYAQKRPFDEAWENGFDSLEVDVFPVNGKLLVGHNQKDLKADRSIETMYLSKLDAFAKTIKQWPQGFPPDVHFILVDVKQDGEKAYQLLKELLPKYKNLWKQRRYFWFVISGDRAIKSIAADNGKYASIDGRFPDVGKGYSKAQMLWVSADWSDYFKWNGKGEMPTDEVAKMKELTTQAHKDHRLVRFWGAPDTEAVWKAQVEAGVDIINTDHLAELAQWRRMKEPK